MRTIYFTNPDNDTRIASTITDLSIDELIDYGVITKDTAYLEHTDENQDSFPSPQNIELYFDSLVFDNADTPTAVTFDLDSAKSVWLEMIRTERDQLLSLTDQEMIKAIGMDKTELVDVIRKDKELLRDITDTIDLKKITNINELNQLRPPELEIDYEYRYNNFTPTQKNSRVKKKSTT